MKKFICFFAAAAFIALMMPLYVYADDENIENEASPREEHIGIILAEAESGTVLYESASHEKLPCGSLCKLMTLLLTAERINSGDISPDDVFTVSEHANSMQGAQIWLMPGEKMSLSDLLAAVVIGNANDASAVIAEAVSGSEDRFTELMNSRAAELGMTDTYYVNSSGYESDGSYTTAYDTALLMSELSRYNYFDELCTTRLAYLKDGGVQLVTSNPSAVRFGGSFGFKAGFTGDKDDRRYYAAEGARRNGDTYVAAVIGSPDEEYAAARAFELLEYGFSAYETVFPGIPADMPREVDVRGGKSGKVRVRASGLRRMVVSKGTSDDITSRTALPESIYAPVARDERIGEIIYYYKGKYAYTADICAVRNVECKTLISSMGNMLKNLFDLR